MQFKMLHDRFPTWADAMAHCSEAVQNIWKSELKKRSEDMKRSTPLRRKTRLKRKTWMRRISKRRSGERAKYLLRRKIFLAKHPYCQWWLAEHGKRESQVLIRGGGLPFISKVDKYPGCFDFWRVPYSREIHHKNKRTGARLLDESQWMAVSRAGHKWIEAHKSEARAKGYLLNF